MPPRMLEHLGAGQLVYLHVVLQDNLSSDFRRVQLPTSDLAEPEVHSFC